MSNSCIIQQVAPIGYAYIDWPNEACDAGNVADAPPAGPACSSFTRFSDSYYAARTWLAPRTALGSIPERYGCADGYISNGGIQLSCPTNDGEWILSGCVLDPAAVTPAPAAPTDVYQNEWTSLHANLQSGFESLQL